MTRRKDDLTSRTFRGSDAGAEATETRRNARFNEGGKKHMFGQQEATVKTRGHVGPDDARGPGRAVAEGGKNRMAAFRPAVPAREGITGNPVPASRKDRNYGKDSKR